MIVNTLRISDIVVKLSLTAILLYVLYWFPTMMLTDKHYLDRIKELKERSSYLALQKSYAQDVQNHIYQDQLLTKKELYKVLTNAVKDNSNSYTVAMTLTKSDPSKDNITRYASDNVTSYKVNMIVGGNILDIRNIIGYLEENCPYIFWNEIIYDAGKFPAKYASVTFYVLAK